jgi:hypothetical protein
MKWKKVKNNFNATPWPTIKLVVSSPCECVVYMETNLILKVSLKVLEFEKSSQNHNQEV